MVSFNNELGSTDYYLLANIFKLDPGLHMVALDAAAKSFKGLQANSAVMG